MARSLTSCAGLIPAYLAKRGVVWSVWADYYFIKKNLVQIIQDFIFITKLIGTANQFPYGKR